MCSSNAAVVCLYFNEGRWSGMSTMIQYVLYLAILVVLAIPLGAYIKKNWWSPQQPCVADGWVYLSVYCDRSAKIYWNVVLNWKRMTPAGEWCLPGLVYRWRTFSKKAIQKYVQFLRWFADNRTAEFQTIDLAVWNVDMGSSLLVEFVVSPPLRSWSRSSSHTLPKAIAFICVFDYNNNGFCTNMWTWLQHVRLPAYYLSVS